VPGHGPQARFSARSCPTRTAERTVGWNPNIQKKRYYLPSERRWITLTVSAKGIKTIDKRGIERVVADLRASGQKI